ncbi:hypothetical protein AAE478_008542 [Parahypoxylon ruwenzoriense]
MRASTLAADLVSAVILLACLTGILAVPQGGNLLIRRDSPPDDSSNQIDYELFGGPEPDRGAYNYPTPTYGGYGPPPPPPPTSRAPSSILSGSSQSSLSTTSPTTTGISPTSSFVGGLTASSVSGLESTQSTVTSESETISPAPKETSSTLSAMQSSLYSLSSGGSFTQSTTSEPVTSPPFPVSNGSLSIGPTESTATMPSLSTSRSGTEPPSETTRTGSSILPSRSISNSVSSLYHTTSTSSPANPTGQGISSSTESTETSTSTAGFPITGSGLSSSATFSHPPYPASNTTIGTSRTSILNTSLNITSFPMSGPAVVSSTISTSTMVLSSVPASGTLTESPLDDDAYWIGRYHYDIPYISISADSVTAVGLNNRFCSNFEPRFHAVPLG